MYRPLDVLVCEDHPVSRLVMEKLLERLRCRTVTAQSGTEASRYAMSEVKFDIIFTEARLPQLTGSDFARMVRKTKNINSTTPIVAVTGYLKELPPTHFFDGLIEKPPTIQKLTEIMGRLCQWKPPPPVHAAVIPSITPAPSCLGLFQTIRFRNYATVLLLNMAIAQHRSPLDSLQCLLEAIVVQVVKTQ